MTYALAHTNSGTTEGTPKLGYRIVSAQTPKPEPQAAAHKRKLGYRIISAQTPKPESRAMINFCVREALNFFSDPTQQFGLTTTVPAVNDPTQQFGLATTVSGVSDPTQQFGLTTTVSAVNDPTQQFGLATTVSGVCEALTFFPDPMQQFGFGTVMAGERVPSPVGRRADIGRDRVGSDRNFFSEDILRYWWQLFLKSPRSATTAITEIQDFTPLFLRALVDAPSRLINPLIDLLRTRSTPQNILTACLRGYEETKRESYLTIAVSLLEFFGATAWPTLVKLAESDRAECELFVRLIATCPGVDSSDRFEAFSALAENPNREVRIQLFEHLSVLEEPRRKQLLRVLTDDSDSEIRRDAIEFLR